MFLLCSDGLSKAMGDTTVAGILVETPFQEVPRRLIDAALAAGSKDNVTVVVVRIGPEKTAVVG